jgi:polygalacturonase
MSTSFQRFTFPSLIGIAVAAALFVSSGRTAEPPAGGIFDVRSFGAKGDGHTLDTTAINQAIDAAAAAGGGTVRFSSGTYPSFSIHLKSHVTLDLGVGATLLAAEPPTEGNGGYDAPEPNAAEPYEDFGHAHWHNSLIWGENVEDVAIVGLGRIYGYGLHRGTGNTRRDLLPEERRRGVVEVERPLEGPGVPAITPGPFGYPNARDILPAGIGNKAIAFKNCRNITLRDITIYHGGHFGVLATGVDNLTADNLKIDTNRDGIDVDCCRNVHISNCSVNSPRDDGICLKSSFGLGVARACENISITNCHVSGYDEGTMLDCTYQRRDPNPEPGGPTGRIKFGTESNGGFKNVVVSNCVFDYCRGLALEIVDGGWLEDVSISNITMRDPQNGPLFIRLGRRNRGPNDPAVGVLRRVNISNIVVSNADPRFGALIVGLPGHPIEGLTLSHLRFIYRGGGTAEDAARAVPEGETEYPEPDRFGRIPAYGLFCRHVKDLTLNDVKLGFVQPEARPPMIFDDVAGLDLDHIAAQHAPGVPALVLHHVTDVTMRATAGLPDQHQDRVDDQKR